MEPELYSEKMVKARKSHKCCECRNLIHKGETYQLAKGLWDGSFSAYRTCAACATIRADYIEKSGADDICFGELKESVSQAFYKGFGIKEFLKEYPENQEEFKKMFLGEFVPDHKELELRRLIEEYYEKTPDTVSYVEARKMYSELKRAAGLLGFDNKQFVRIRDEISRAYD